MESLYDMDVSKEDELYLRNNWKLISTCQFINMFKNVMKLKDPLTPYDLEQSLLRPQHDPLCAELMCKLLHKRMIRKDQNGVEIQPKNDNIQVLDYDSWNMMLAKKFSMMHKNYRKFAIRFLGKDPLQQQNENEYDLQSQNPLEEQKHDQSIQQHDQIEITHQEENQEQKNDLNSQSAPIQNQELNQSAQANQNVEEEKKEDNKQSMIIQNQISQRMTRSQLAKLNNPQQSQNKNDQKQNQKNTKNGKQKQSQESNILSQMQEEKKEVIVEQVWSSDIREHLLKQHNEENITIRFSHQAAIGGVGLQNQWKTESLQLIKLFNEELDDQDPFYIEGQDWNQQKEDQTNYWSNFVDTEAIEDFEDYQYGSYKAEVLFKKFHEIPTRQRLSILYFLCQNKLDSESPEFMQEVLNLQQTKLPKFESEDGQPLKMSDELKIWLEPINMALLKPLGVSSKNVGPFTLNEITIEIKPGSYFYFPFFSDTRIYRQSFDFTIFELFLEEYDHIQVLLTLLKENENDEECLNFQEKLSKYQEVLKKQVEEMKWREQTKARKLKSQIRSRKLQDLSRKKLNFEGRNGQYQTDYLHHTQKNVMTRGQVDTVKQKYGGNKNSRQYAGEESEEEIINDNNKRRDGKGNTAKERYQQQLKIRQEKEREAHEIEGKDNKWQWPKFGQTQKKG